MLATGIVLSSSVRVSVCISVQKKLKNIDKKLMKLDVIMYYSQP